MKPTPIRFTSRLRVMASIMALFLCLPARAAESKKNGGTLTDAASTKEFQEKHDQEAPPPLPEGGETVTLQTSSGSSKAYRVRPKDPGGAGVILIHEWWGLNDNVRKVAHDLADLGYTALAVDLYGTSTTDREEAARLMKAVDEEEATGIVTAAVNHLKDEEDLEHIGTIGWCFGGGWSLRTALAAGRDVDACVVYYGELITDPEKLENLQAPVLAIIAEKDGWITPKMAKEFEKACEAAGKEVTVRIYPADHAFANPTSPRHHEPSARKAWAETRDFYERHLGEE